MESASICASKRYFRMRSALALLVGGLELVMDRR
jgi:hypothetical protein